MNYLLIGLSGTAPFKWVSGRFQSSVSKSLAIENDREIIRKRSTMLPSRYDSRAIEQYNNTTINGAAGVVSLDLLWSSCVHSLELLHFKWVSGRFQSSVSESLAIENNRKTIRERSTMPPPRCNSTAIQQRTVLTYAWTSQQSFRQQQNATCLISLAH